MTSLPFDLPTLRKHHTYFTINNKRIPTLYRLKSGIYYPYVAFELVQAELEDHCSTWTTTRQLPLLPMTVNELLFYKSLCPNSDFSASSTVILCSLIDQLRQLITFLKDTTNATLTRSRKSFARFSIDANSDSVREIDILNSEATTKYDILRSTLLPSMQNVKRRLCFDDEKADLASIGGFLQLDQCIYPYIISSSQILLHLNDLRKPFAPTLPTLMPHFHPQSPHLLKNYRKVVEYGTRYIKKYKYYYQHVEDKFISLHQLLSSHRSMFFVQLFNSRKVSLKDLHEHYRSDYAKLITNSIAHCGYLNGQPCVNEWSLSDGTVARENKARLATPNEVLLINWLLIYNDQGVNVHQQAHELVLVKQACSLLNEKIKLLSNEHLRKRSILMNHNAI